jgi:hypothetical protein
VDATDPQVTEAISPGGQDLTVGQILACFRLIGHARTAMNRPKTSSISPPVDLALLFVPCKLLSALGLIES